MIQTISFISGDVSLIYAMPFSRTRKAKRANKTFTTRIVKKPEIEVKIGKKPILILDHKVMWKILDLMDSNSKFYYKDYLRMIDEEPENFSDLINSHLESYPNVLFYGITENDVLKEISMEKQDHNLAKQTRIIINEVGRKLDEYGFHYTFCYTNFGKTAHYVNFGPSGKSTVIEIIIKRDITHIVGRVKYEEGWLQPIKHLTLRAHITNITPQAVFNWIHQFLDNAQILSSKIAADESLPYKDKGNWEKLTFEDRNKLERETAMYFGL